MQTERAPAFLQTAITHEYMHWQHRLTARFGMSRVLTGPHAARIRRAIHVRIRARRQRRRFAE